VRVPVASIGKICLFTHQAIGAPGNNVHLAERHIKSAGRAQVHLDGRGRRDTLHIPEPRTFRFGAPQTCNDTVEINGLVGLIAGSAAARSITARHQRGAGDQYRAYQYGTYQYGASVQVISVQGIRVGSLGAQAPSTSQRAGCGPTHRTGHRNGPECTPGPR